MFNFGIATQPQYENGKFIVDLYCGCEVYVDEQTGKIIGYGSCNKQHEMTLSQHRFGWADYEHYN